MRQRLEPSLDASSVTTAASAIRFWPHYSCTEGNNHVRVGQHVYFSRLQRRIDAELQRTSRHGIERLQLVLVVPMERRFRCVPNGRTIRAARRTVPTWHRRPIMDERRLHAATISLVARMENHKRA